MSSEEPVPQPSGGAELKLSLPAHHAAAREGRQRVRDFVQNEGMDAGEIERLEFVVGELLSNAVDHGGGGGAMDAAGLAHGSKGLQMHLDLTFDHEGWILRVEDEGGGDPESLRSLIQGTGEMPDLEDERGRGFFLLQAMLTSLEIESSRSGAGIALVAEVRFGMQG